ncbi:MAG TPA: sugar-binding domain-containing protein [Ktedonobacteraceae bacterium]|jgi:deoxyribonucleoside regulator
MPDITQGNRSEARLLVNERFLRKVAYMYYEDGHSQETIADMEFCSRQTVSKALQKAKEQGIVRISIVPDLRTGYLRNLSREARRELNLEDLILVPGRKFEDVGADKTLDEVVAEITNAAADYLDQLLTDSDILAVSGGRTFMRNVVRYLEPTKPLPHLRVVSTIGFVEPRTSPGDANLVAYDIARAYCASHAWYTVPAFIPHILGVSAEALIEDNTRNVVTRDAVQLSHKANVVIMGLWPPYTNDQVIMRGILSRQQINAIEAFHPAVDINHWFFDAEGHCINEIMDPPPYYLTGFPIPRLKEKITQEGSKVILVAGAGPSYVPAIRAALKAGLANILVTDHITAQLLLSSV